MRYIVEPGTLVVIEQVIGRCEDGTVFTEATRTQGSVSNPSNAYKSFPCKLLIFVSCLFMLPHARFG